MRAIFFTFSPFYVRFYSTFDTKNRPTPNGIDRFLLLFIRYRYPISCRQVTPCQQRNVRGLRQRERHQR